MRAPMTSVVMIFEITRDYAVIVPLMISNLVSYFIASRIQREPIYEVLAEQDGIHLPRAGTRLEVRERQVEQAMKPAGDLLDAEETAESAMAKMGIANERAQLVRDSRGVIGVVTKEQLQKAGADGEAAKSLREILGEREFPHVHVDQSLELALARMGELRTDLLPVVSRADVHELLGIVRLQDVLEVYGVDQKVES